MNDCETVIGIDVGVNGAIAAMDIRGNTPIACVDMPTVATLSAKKTKREVCPLGVLGVLEEIASVSIVRLVVIEDVHAMPKQGVASMFNFGFSAGIIRGVVAGKRLRYEVVAPRQWKKHHGLIGKDKDCARTLVNRWYPDLGLIRKKDVDRADAVLLALWGMETVVRPSVEED